MHEQIYVNPPVGDLKRSMAFFEDLGCFGFDLQSTNERGACMVMGDNIYAMLLDRLVLPDPPGAQARAG